MIEKRTSQRHRVLKGATITFGGHDLACTVRNLSAGGAAIDLSAPALLPSSFTLLIQRDRLIRRCRPVWRNEHRIGVAFH